MEKDPVCGMLVDPQQAAGQRTVEGRTYYLCSADCLKRFDQAPRHYAKADAPQKNPEPS